MAEEEKTVRNEIKNGLEINWNEINEVAYIFRGNNFLEVFPSYFLFIADGLTK